MDGSVVSGQAEGGWLDGWMGRQMDGGCMGRWRVDGWMDRQISEGWVDRWLDGQTVGWKVNR